MIRLLRGVNFKWNGIRFIFCFGCVMNSFLFLVFLKVDEYGTQQPIALLKLLLERGGMYDRGKELNLKHYRDIGFIAAMGKVRS